MLSIEQALASWRRHSPCAPAQAQTVELLFGGQTNTSYLIEAEEKRWVVRLGATKTAALGIDRQTEKIILAAAAAADLCPPVAHCAPETGVLITQYIDGTHFTCSANEASRARLFELVTRIHTLNVALPETDYYAHAERYWSLLVEAGIAVPAELKSKRKAIAQSQQDLGSNSSRLGVCHRDLNPSNIIASGNDLFVLDWEYAAFGMCTFDYACLAVEFDIPLSRLAAHYALPINELQHALDLYRYTCELWRLVKRLKA